MDVFLHCQANLVSAPTCYICPLWDLCRSCNRKKVEIQYLEKRFGGVGFFLVGLFSVITTSHASFALHIDTSVRRVEWGKKESGLSQRRVGWHWWWWGTPQRTSSARGNLVSCVFNRTTCCTTSLLQQPVEKNSSLSCCRHVNQSSL